MRFTPGGIRKGASGHNVCFIHPKANDELPIGGEGVLIELVQAPPDVVARSPRPRCHDAAARVKQKVAPAGELAAIHSSPP